MATEDSSGLQPSMFSFVVRPASSTGPRLGQLATHGRAPIPTPNFVVSTSRGAVPHVTQDVLSNLTGIRAVHIGLEDFIEKTAQKAPIFQQTADPFTSRLRRFTALPQACLSILGPRRVPPLECPSQNTNSSVSICTSVGFQYLDCEDYLRSSQALEADITVSIADVVHAAHSSQKRLEKSADRTHAWVRDTISARTDSETARSALFASVPPLEAQQQSFYLSDLCDEYRSDIAGLSLYAPETVAELPQSLEKLPRLCLISPESPHDILRAVSLGNDLITLALVTEASEKGIAFAFALDGSSDSQDKALGFDLWHASNATALTPLVENCQCYTCTQHHRAYLHHLLSAKEMLAWTLLQVHNFHVMTLFFEDIRTAVEAGTFENKSKAFNQNYALKIPATTGEGPRIRGYQAKSVGGGEPKRNRKVYGRLDEQSMKLEEAESGIATPEAELRGHDLEKQGLGAVQ